VTLRPDPLAYPPRGLSREEAARYIGVGPTKFDDLVADGRMPKAKRIDGCVRWDRFALDMAFTDIDARPANKIDAALQESAGRR
jgi:predicted DNA-binding transcriptional regulator AlpA